MCTPAEPHSPEHDASEPVKGWGTGSIRVRAADGHLTEIRTTAPPDDAEFVVCPDRLDRLARELLDVASTAPDPLPLVEAARALLSMSDRAAVSHLQSD